MLISKMVFPAASFARFVDDIVDCERHGFHAAWVPQIFGWDALVGLAVAADRTTTLRLGTAVLPVYPTHPLVLAASAMSLQAASAGRFTLGVGTSHRFIVEQSWGHSFARPRSFVAEYLQVLVPAMAGQSVAVHGTQLSGVTVRPLETPGVMPPPVLLAAMGPAMLTTAGRQADGTITWLTGPRTLARDVVPTIQAAAAGAGRCAPQVVAGLPVCVTDDMSEARAAARAKYSAYDGVPSYRATLDREGLAFAGDVALVGSTAEVGERIAALAAAGVTQLCADIFGTADECERTTAVLAELATAAGRRP
jgi:F420-dependent oxidoreductase-like protein